MEYDFKAGDTGSKLQVTCRDSRDNKAINLAGSTVGLLWRRADAVLEQRTMTIIDAAGGVAEYQFLTGELVAPGMDFHVRITDSGGAIVTNVNTIYKTVRAAV